MLYNRDIKTGGVFMYNEVSLLSIRIIFSNRGIINYRINPDDTIDVDGDVDLSDMGWETIPMKFGIVGGSFSIHSNRLRTLVNSPSIVGKDYYCDNNCLSSLYGGPVNVGGRYSCGNNKLDSLYGAPSIISGTIGSGFLYTPNESLTVDMIRQYSKDIGIPLGDLRNTLIRNGTSSWVKVGIDRFPLSIEEEFCIETMFR